VKLVKLLVFAFRGNRGGVLLEIHDDGEVVRGVWVRRYKTWRGWWSSRWRGNSNVVVLEQEDLLG